MRLGPVALALRSGPWPFGFGPLARPHPGAARARAELRVEFRERAGEEGPLRFTGEGYVGPGFALEGGGGDYRATARDAASLGGALGALLIDLGRRAPLVLVHGASVAFGGRAWCWAGPSGAGKSTWVRRHERRALGSNATLLWPEAGAWWAQALPLTGKGDAAVSPRGLRLGGLWVAGGGRRRPRAPAQAMAWLASAVATARGLGPRLDLIEAIVRGYALGARAGFGAAGFGGPSCEGAEHSLASWAPRRARERTVFR